MLLFFDECIPDDVCQSIRLLGIPSTDVRAQNLQGVDDADLPAIAVQLGAIFVTLDLDFTSKPIY